MFSSSSIPSGQRRWLAGLLIASAFAAVLAVALVLPQAAVAAPTLQADVASPAAGNVLLGVEGTFSTAGKNAMLKRINEIRKEACTQGVPNPGDPSEKLTPSDYVPMRWSKDLETIAQTRAAESSLFQGHTRPNGTSCFTAHQDLTVTTCAENLAWNYSGMAQGVEQWYGEKADWVSQNSSAVTGHYTSLINPSYTLVGLGSFAPAQGGWTATAGEFSYDPSQYDESVFVDQSETGVKGSHLQLVEIPSANISGCAVEGNTSFTKAATRTYKAYLQVSAKNAWGAKTTVLMSPTAAPSWKSSNAKVVSVSATGKVSVKHSGKAKVSATALGKTGSATLTVKPAKATFKKLTAKKKALKATWVKAGSLASGYQVRYSQKKSMSGAKTVTVKGAGKTATTLKKLKSGKRYYVQVRTYEKVSGKIITGAWSAKKSAKAK